MSKLTDAQRGALIAGSARVWRGAREAGVMGSTMVALERRGLAVVELAHRPYRRLTYRLTPEGARRRHALALADLARQSREDQRRAGERENAAVDAALARQHRTYVDAIDRLYPPAVSEGVRCRCSHCGAVFKDATPGGSCGRCGQAVIEL